MLRSIHPPVSLVLSPVGRVAAVFGPLAVPPQLPVITVLELESEDETDEAHATTSTARFHHGAATQIQINHIKNIKSRFNTMRNAR